MIRLNVNVLLLAEGPLKKPKTPLKFLDYRILHKYLVFPKMHVESNHSVTRGLFPLSVGRLV